MPPTPDDGEGQSQHRRDSIQTEFVLSRIDPLMNGDTRDPRTALVLAARNLGPDNPEWLLHVSPPVLAPSGVSVSQVTARAYSHKSPLRWLADEWFDRDVLVVIQAPSAGLWARATLRRREHLVGRARVERVLEEIERYAKDHGLAELTWTTHSDAERIGREIGRLTSDPATPDNVIARLERLPGWRAFSANWAEAIGRFAEREGHLQIPEGHTEDGVRIDLALRHYWLLIDGGRRVGASLVSPGVVDRLEALPGWDQLDFREPDT